MSPRGGTAAAGFAFPVLWAALAPWSDVCDELLIVTNLAGGPPLSAAPDLSQTADGPSGEVGDRR